MAKQFICRPDYPVVQTKHGKLRGYVEDGTFKFFGIKYADAKRWQMPVEVADWDGIKDVFGYGYVSPMLRQDTPGSGELKVPHRYWPMDENCQYLNVWTSSIDPSAKKAVMVWYHGGGYSAGSSIEQVCYDGTSLAANDDVVVVTVNHRLNILGYFDVSEYGEEYYNSANVGNADMVASLQWVHDNIQNFGGDPENVTIFGQSGGGMKVISLMQTPAADGLFQHGIAMSGYIVQDDAMPEGGSKAIVEAMLAETGAATVQEMAEMPYSVLADAYNKVAPDLRKAGKYIGGNGPIKGDWYCGDPVTYGWREHAQGIEMLIGSVIDEFKGFMPGRPDRLTMSEETAHEMVAAEYGDKADKAIELFKAAYPGKNLCDLMAIDTVFRPSKIKLIESRSKECSAATYSYLFAFDFPLDCGAGAWHCSDIPFAFHNAALVPICNQPGVTDALEHRYSAAYTNFAKYGNPADPSLPCWPACEVGKENTMVFDVECAVRTNHDHELISLAVENAANFMGKIEH